ncbi:hypothetical protein B0H19DRAFT_89537 [Mycena capillaripes]|nr:hypothetical protein B0H19DRAFT_89537 [Mycena capillaripes]
MLLRLHSSANTQDTARPSPPLTQQPMAEHSQSSDEEFIFNVEDEDCLDSSSAGVGDTFGVSGQDPLHAFAPGYLQTDIHTSTPHYMGIRAQSFGEQSTPPPTGGRRRRTQSDSPSYPIPEIFFGSTDDGSAVEDEYAPPSNLPPMTTAQSEHTNAQWWTTAPGNGLTLSPLPQNPGLLSPREARAASDTSSIRSSLSPSLSHSGLASPFLPSPDPDNVPLRYVGGGSPDPPNYNLPSNAFNQAYSFEAESPLRGRLTRRGERQKPRHLNSSHSSLGASARTLERLSIQDGLFGEQSYATQGGAPHHPSSIPRGDSQPASLWPEGSLLSPGWSNEGSSLYPPRSPSIRSPSTLSSTYSPSSPFDLLNFPGGFEGNSFEVGRSRSHSHVSTSDADLFADSHGNADRRLARAQRRRQASPYPVAGPSTGEAEGSSAAYWPLKGLGDESAGGLSHHDGQAPNPLFTTDPRLIVAPPDFQSVSFSWNIGQDSQDQPPAFRASVATHATRRAATARRNDPTKRGAFLCRICGHDFTAMHNLKNHLNSHASRKNYKCGGCGVSFGTAHVLKRHKRTCGLASSGIKKRTT